MSNKPDEIELLLPWKANGTLNEEELAMVTEYLETHPDQQVELEFLEALREGVRAEQQGSPGAFGLKRLLKEIHQEQQSTSQTLTNQPAANDNTWWKASLTAAALVILVQGGLLINTFTGEGQDIQLLGEKQGATLVLQIEFQPVATEDEIRGLLKSVSGRFVDGPSAVGLYRIEIDRQNLEAEDIQKLVSEIAARADVIKYVEQN